MTTPDFDAGEPVELRPGDGEIRNWEGDVLPDLSFAVFALKRKSKTFRRYRELLLYVVFVGLHSYSVIAGHYHQHGYYMANGVGGVAGDGEWNQAGSTGLYFEKTHDDIGQTSDWYSWAQSDQTMLSVFGQPEDTMQQQNKIMPGVVHVTQRRVVDSNPSHHCPGANKLLGGNWDGMAGCFPSFTERAEDRGKMPYPGSATANADCYGPCGCDVLGHGGFEFEEVAIGSLSCKVPSPARSLLPWVGRFAEYPADSFHFYMRSNTSVAAWQAKVQCLSDNNWLDSATRQVEITFFTYNPHFNMFLHHRLSSEFSPAGFVYNAARFTPFRWWNFETETVEAKSQIVVDIIVFILLCQFMLRLLIEIVSDMMERKRVCIVWFSVWRLVDVVLYSFFMVQYVWKFIHWQFQDIALRSPEKCADLGCAATICTDPRWDTNRLPDGTPAGEAWEFFYLTELHALLTGFAVRYIEINKLVAMTAMLTWLKLFQFVSLSPRLSLLSETIKESAAALVSLLGYIFIITGGFALMGLVLFSSYSEKLSTFEKALFYLFRWNLGDFDYDELLDATMHNHTLELFVFFWGYQLLVWVVLLNMVISIVSVGFEIAKHRAAKAVGEVALGPLMRNSVDELEMFVRTMHWKKHYPAGPFTLRPDGYRVCGMPLRVIIKAMQQLEAEVYAGEDELMEDCCCGHMTTAGRKGTNQDSVCKNIHPRCVTRAQVAKTLVSRECGTGGVYMFKHLCGTPVDEHTADTIAAALCWIFAERGPAAVNRRKPAMYEARVYWDMQVRELRKQMGGEFKDEFLETSDAERVLDLQGGRRMSDAQKLDATQFQLASIQAEVGALRRSIEALQLVPPHPTPATDSQS
eukprot:TRINITY_DN5675_c0_g2_i1.p1 TRINITY_DN5675_c0_g2~~TRINITY_DN5675_c0_g2_i1.p1  ORF type:complete len:860 (+),score=319.15 TRINITY_DN5675_c0_g2_i1:80-2659(+)